MPQGSFRTACPRKREADWRVRKVDHLVRGGYFPEGFTIWINAELAFLWQSLDFPIKHFLVVQRHHRPTTVWLQLWRHKITVYDSSNFWYMLLLINFSVKEHIL